MVAVGGATAYGPHTGMVVRFSINQLARTCGQRPRETREAVRELARGPLRPLEGIPDDDDKTALYELMDMGGRMPW